MGVVISAADSGLALADVLPAQTERRPVTGSVPVSFVLDESYRLLSSGSVREGMDLLVAGLRQTRLASDAPSWSMLCQTEVLDHPVGSLLWQDPFTRHSFQKPKGYSGDAQLLDYIYGDRPAPEGTTPLGAEIFKYAVNGQAGLSVRARRELLAGVIDETADQFPSPRILSLACGHLREGSLSRAVQEKKIEELVALDQDAESLAEVHRLYGDNNVRTVHSSVRALLTGKPELGSFNLIYASGLYDYLSERVASRLTRLLFEMLRPGGRLLVANFAPCLHDIGYMETFMGWRLIYREADQMAEVSKEIPSAHWSSHRMFWDQHENVIFLDLTKRAAKVSITINRGLDQLAVPGLRNVKINRSATRRGRKNGKAHESES